MPVQEGRLTEITKFYKIDVGSWNILVLYMFSF